MKQVKCIFFRWEMKGNGIVNFDSGDQKYIWNQVKDITFAKDDNNSFGKKNFYYDENGDLHYKNKISSNCIRHEIFKDAFMFQSPNIQKHPELLLISIASPGSLLRGYVNFPEDGSFKRSSAFTVVSAEQTTNNKSTLEFFSRSGEKIKDENQSDTSIFTKETIGDVEYLTLGGIDLMQLQFLSCDETFDRYGLNPDYYDQYVKLLSPKIKDLESNLGYYQINGSDIQIPEYGIKFSEKTVNNLIKDLFRRILEVNIMKSGAYATTSRLQYKLVYDPIEDKIYDDKDWVDLKRPEDFKHIKIQDFYVLEDAEKSISLKKELVDIREAIKVKTALKKKLENEKNAAKKAKKEVESTNEIL